MKIFSSSGSVLCGHQHLDKGRQEEHEHPPEEMKQTSLWMKRHKSALRAFVRAGIYIEPNTAKRLATKAFALMYEKFWGFPMLTVATRDEALALARILLPDAQTDAGSH
ncbi:hypothetical protein B7759_05776 (plasmid) [Burkholderia glumae]|nr:hypothetical protein B7759_05776 [Burkholderia glumae]